MTMLGSSFSAILFTDLVGSTAFTERHGDEGALKWLEAHDDLVRSVLANHQGREVKTTGDGFLVVFGSCIDAVRCALDIQASLDEYNTNHPDCQIQVRIGVHCGHIVDRGRDIHGQAVNIAARIAAKAAGGQVLVSDSVRTQVPPQTVPQAVEVCAFIDRGLFWLKGLRERWRLYEATRQPQTVVYPMSEDRTPFVGRDLERSALRLSVDRAEAGHGSLVLLNGGSGVGKTRLAEEIGAEARRRGMLFLVGQSNKATQGFAYGPVVEVLEALERALDGDEFFAAMGDTASEIARLLPYLRRKYPDIGPPPQLEPHQERRFLFASVRAFLLAVSVGSPLVILFDDLHMADGPSLLFLEYVAAELSNVPILVIGAYTTEDLSAASPLRDTLANLYRLRRVERMELSEFELEDVSELLERIADAPPPAHIAKRLHQETGGNAFFLEALLRHLADRGGLFDEMGNWVDTVGSASDLPETVRTIVGHRLEQLEPSTGRILTTAALIGQDFEFTLLQAVTGVGEDALVDALDEAERARLIKSTVEDEQVRLSFAHGLIRLVLDASVSLTRRQREHLRIADALESAFATTLAERAADIVYHLERAGRLADESRSAPLLLMAGDSSLRAAAYEEALRHFHRALRALSPDLTQLRAAILEHMGQAERSLGHLGDALSLWREAMDLYHELGALEEVARVCLDAAVQVAWWRKGREFSDLVQLGLRAIGGHDTPTRAGLLALAGAAASQRGAYEEGTELLLEALSAAQRHRVDRILGIVLYQLAAHHFAYEEFPETVAYGLESISYLKVAGDSWSLANVQGYVASAQAWLGRLDEAASLGAGAQVLAFRLGNWAAWVFAETAGDFREQGRAPDHHRLAERGEHIVALGRDLGFRWLESLGHGRLGLAAFRRGAWNEAIDHFAASRQLEPASRVSGYVGLQFLTLSYEGARREALELIDDCRRWFPVPGRASSLAEWNLGAAAIEALAMLGERGAAAALYPLAAGALDSGRMMRGPDLRFHATLAGVAAACGQEWERSERHFEEALRLAEQMPMALERLDARRFYGWMLLDQGRSGDAGRARVLLSDALDGYLELAMEGHARLTRQLLTAAS
jgi:class 3 adenylate cyclase/tetratricopeptide (TPR) repeat protein